MRHYRIIFTAMALILVFALAVFAESVVEKNPAGMPVAKVGKNAPEFTLTDASGEKHSLSDFEGKFVVLEWINFDCPFVKKYYNSGQMQKLQEEYSKKDITWLAICSSAPGKQGYFSGDELTAAIKNHKMKSDAYLIDSDGTVGKMYQAKTTPNMFIIDPEGTLIYAGAIDDKPSPKMESLDGARNYVSEALDLAISGKEVKVKATQPYGCSVKYSSSK